MPQIQITVGDDWDTGKESPPFDVGAVPRIGEGLRIAGEVTRVKDVIHELSYDDDGRSVFRSKVLVTPEGRGQKLFG